MPHTGDFVLGLANGKPALDNESIQVIGTWVDFTGSETIFPSDVYYGGAANKASPRAKFEGANIDDVDSRGFRTGTHRSRQFLEYIKLDKHG